MSEAAVCTTLREGSILNQAQDGTIGVKRLHVIVYKGTAGAKWRRLCLEKRIVLLHETVSPLPPTPGATTDQRDKPTY